ncbi:MAG: glycosyltransferase [Bacteroidales bacterium]|nr:glycosyltransferase [Bacteroidales bacterium]
MKVSIVTPIYRCAPYIKGCLQSLMAQTCQDFEVLLVDDHGGDGSMDLAHAFVEQEGVMEKFRFLETPRNSGPGVARNVGLEAAKGEYVAFIDSDDEWKPTFLEKLLHAAETSQTDLAFCQLKYRGGANDGRVFRNPVVEAGAFTFEAKRHFLLHFVTFSVCFLFRRQFLDENELRFPDERNSEDTNFLTRCLLLARRIACVDEPLYVYCVRDESLSTGRDKHRYKTRLSALNKLKKAFDAMKQDGRYADLHLEQFDGVMRILWFKKGLAQSVKDYIKNNI